MAKTNSNESNPALKPLEILVGEWELELSGGTFLPNPSDKITGQVSFEWVENGAFFVMRMGDRATWLMNRDDASPDYKAFYYDSRKVSRIYEMSFSGNTWKMWRNAPGFSQRYEGKISGDGNTITAKWEKSLDGLTWEHDFDLVYKRM